MRDLIRALCAALAGTFMLGAASTASAQHPDDRLAEPARQFEPTLAAAARGEDRAMAVRQLLDMFLFGGAVRKGPDGADAVYIFTRSEYAYAELGSGTPLRLALVAGVVGAARDRGRGVWINPGRDSEFYLAPADVAEVLRLNPDLEPPPPPQVIIP